MQTRREIIKAGAGIAAILAAGKAPAAFVRSALAARNSFAAGGGETPPAPEPRALCFTAEQAGSTISMSHGSSAPTLSLETSPDGIIWTPFIPGMTVITLENIGDEVLFRAGAGGNLQISSSVAPARLNTFAMSGKIAASGDATALLDRANPVMAFTVRYTFAMLFKDCSSLTTAPLFPTTTLFGYDYRDIFYGCTSLTTAPKLPATTLVNNCYRNLFYGCSSLKALDVAFTSFNPSGSTTDWLYGVAETGIFRCPTALGTAATISRGANYCPAGWTVENTD